MELLDRATDRQVHALACMFYAHGYRDRGGRLQAAAAILGADVASFTELTRSQAGHLFAELRRRERAAMHPATANPGESQARMPSGGSGSPAGTRTHPATHAARRTAAPGDPGATAWAMLAIAAAWLAVQWWQLTRAIRQAMTAHAPSPSPAPARG